MKRTSNPSTVTPMKEHDNHQHWSTRIMKKLLLAGLLAISTCCICAQTEVKAWSKLIGAANYDFGGGRGG